MEEKSKESRASKEQCSLSTWPGLSSGGGSAFGEQKVLFLFLFPFSLRCFRLRNMLLL